MTGIVRIEHCVLDSDSGDELSRGGDESFQVEGYSIRGAVRGEQAVLRGGTRRRQRRRRLPHLRRRSSTSSPHISLSLREKVRHSMQV